MSPYGSTLANSPSNALRERESAPPKSPPQAALVKQIFRVLDRTSPDLATRLAGLLFLTPPRSLGLPSRLAKLDTGKSKGVARFTFMSDGRRLQAYAWEKRASGQRPTVLLIHGWGGHGRQFEKLVEKLVNAEFRVVTLDLPAHGRSPGRTTNAFEMRRAVLDLVQGDSLQAGLGPLHAVIAHSFGAMVTALALNDGLHLNACAFVAPMTSFSYAVRAFSVVLGLSPRIRDRMTARLEARFGISSANMEVAETAGSRTLPLLVVHDSGDTRVPFELGRALVEAWPGAKLHATSGLGHQRVLADAGVIDGLVRFLSTAPRGEAPSHSGEAR